MQIRAALEGDLRKILAAEVRFVGAAVEAGVREATEGLKRDWREEIVGADLGNLSKSARSKVYRRNGDPIRTVGLVYISGNSARKAVWAFERGADIKPTGGRQYLAVPTHYNRKGGRRGGKVLLTTADLAAKQVPTFVRTGPNGKKLLFAQVAHVQTMKYKNQHENKAYGIVRDWAYIAGTTIRLGSGRQRRSEKILGYGAVPLFTLLPSVHLRKRLDLAKRNLRWAAELPRLIVSKMEAQAHADRS